MYMFPTGGLTDDSSKEEKTKAMERMMEEMKTKPSGLLVYKPAGTEFNFAKCLAVQFVTDFAKALLAAWLLTQTGLDNIRAAGLALACRHRRRDRRHHDDHPALELVRLRQHLHDGERG